MKPVEKSHAHASERYFQPGTILNRILQEAPYLPRCSDNKTAALQRPREYAIRHPYMQINRRGFVSWLIFDLDHKRPWAWQDAGLPAPNMIVQDRTSLKSHAYYAIVPVCTTEAARARPIAYMKAIYTAMAARMDADTDYHSGPVSKTPGHPWWRTSELHGHVYELGELAEYVELEPPRPFAKTVDVRDISHSRHVMLFEFVRQFAYAIVNRERETGNLATFTRLVDAYAHDKNDFVKMGCDADLPLSSIRATVKSVARWTWDNYTGTTRCHRGVMQLDKDLPIPERQRLSAARTHEVRRTGTESKIRRACTVLRARGAAITQAAVASLAKLTRQTVATYKQLLKAPPTATALTVVQPTGKQPDVKYGAHQVTGGVFVPALAVDLPLQIVKIFDDGGGG